MRTVWRLASSVGAVAACLVAGCGFAQKPYADDPLLRGGRAVWLARDAIPPAQPRASPVAIQPPRPPAIATSPRWE